MNNMKKEDLIKLCRYYKGEKKHPKTHDAVVHIAWNAERKWVENFPDKGNSEDMLKDYMEIGLAEFEMQDDTPIILKAYLFNRFCQYSERIDIDAFKKFYFNDYKKGGQ